MNKALRLIFGLLLAMTLSPALGANMQIVENTPDSQEYVDMDSIQRDGDTVSFATHTIFPRGAGKVNDAFREVEVKMGKTIAQSRMIAVIECRSKVIGIRSDSVYDAKGNELTMEIYRDTGLHPIPPDSQAEKIRQMVCPTH